MPLHLLGKKSWNVYNPDNIARVRRDEAAARAREEAEEQRMQQADADRRLEILRGEIPPPLDQHAEPEVLPQSGGTGTHDDHSTWPPGSGRKRKRHGEDDTDFEMRMARERTMAGDRKPLSSVTATTLVDSRGHVSLFPEADTLPPAMEKNEEHEREAARKRREMEDQYQMRFVNAAGKDGQGLTDGGPWYASADGEASAALVPSKDVWGREDPGRKVREAARLDAGDPLAMMKSGAARSGPVLIGDVTGVRKSGLGIRAESEVEGGMKKRIGRRRDDAATMTDIVLVIVRIAEIDTDTETDIATTIAKPPIPTHK
ncbi:Leukocyte receptor cluster member 1 [Madurella mycetomatis]|uniref:Leukocyte receptor cluster member 1 n=1 Tax=Madurella mycetomatis TaxID=100816 RepID=A0A175WFP6_9PEZI|nr:Leukocyte receptor cluster member 1 [Madurella mycetomatis]